MQKFSADVCSRACLWLARRLQFVSRQSNLSWTQGRKEWSWMAYSTYIIFANLGETMNDFFLINTCFLTVRIWKRNLISHHPDRSSSGAENWVCMEYCVMSAGGAGAQGLLFWAFWIIGFTSICLIEGRVNLDLLNEQLSLELLW